MLKNIEELVLKLKTVENNIKEAEAEVRMRKKRLAELVPKKKSIEQECFEQFECKPEMLPELQKTKTAEAEAEADKLIKEMAKITKDN